MNIESVIPLKVFVVFDCMFEHMGKYSNPWRQTNGQRTNEERRNERKTSKQTNKQTNKLTNKHQPNQTQQTNTGWRKCSHSLWICTPSLKQKSGSLASHYTYLNNFMVKFPPKLKGKNTLNKKEKSHLFCNKNSQNLYTSMFLAAGRNPSPDCLHPHCYQPNPCCTSVASIDFSKASILSRLRALSLRWSGGNKWIICSLLTLTVRFLLKQFQFFPY